MLEKRFPNTGAAFSGYHAACVWLREHGYSYGFMQAGSPAGVMLGDYAIMKWRNIPDEDRARLDGTIECDDPRYGEAVVRLKREPAEKAA